MEAFRLLGFSANQLEQTFRILSGILHLGNVSLEPGGTGRADSESSTVENLEALKTMAEMLEIEEEQIKKWLCNRKIVTGRETYTKPMNVEGVRLS